MKYLGIALVCIGVVSAAGGAICTLAAALDDNPQDLTFLALCTGVLLTCAGAVILV